MIEEPVAGIRLPYYTIPAKFEGKCKVCGKPIQVGEPISPGFRGWVHLNCAIFEDIEMLVWKMEEKLKKETGYDYVKHLLPEPVKRTYRELLGWVMGEEDGNEEK